MPWKLALAVVLLAAGVALRTRSLIDMAAAPWWEVVGWAALTVGAAFLVMRWLQNNFWGLVTGAAVLLHPLYWQGGGTFLQMHRMEALKEEEALELVMLAVAIAGWRLAYRPDFAWLEWLTLAAVPVVAVAPSAFTSSSGPGPSGGWPHPDDVASLAAPGATPLLDWSTAALALIVFPVGTLLGAFRYWGGGNGRPHPGNLVCTFCAGLVILLVALLCTPLHALPWQGEATAQLTSPHLRAFEPEQLKRWCWPSVWAMVPLMVWGLLRSVRRGWRQWRKGLPPTPWLLTLHAALVLAAVTTYAGDNPAPVALPLASLAVLLAVFGVAEVFRMMSERLILLPPAERQE